MKKTNLYFSIILFLFGFAALNTYGQERSKSPIENVHKFIGEWVISKEILEKFPEAQRASMAKTSMFTFKWGDKNKTLRMYEMHPHGKFGDAILEAFAAVNPITQKIEFLGFNQKEGFFFKGEFIFDGANKLYRIYDVYYPNDYEWAKQQGITSLKFRDTYTLREDGKIEQVVDFYSSKVKKWSSFTGGKTFILEKKK